MPIITITFDHPRAVPPEYTIGERVAIIGYDCPPQEWLKGKVVGLSLEEIYERCWWYAIKLDAPRGYTEEYLASDLVPEIETARLQTEWEQGRPIFAEENSFLQIKLLD